MRVNDVFGENLRDEDADTLFNVYLEYYKKNWLPFEDVIPCLTWLRNEGYRLSIISNGQDQQQIDKLEKIGVLSYFSHVFTSNKLGVAKPDSRIFRRACERAQCSVEESYYIGDHLETDVIGSNDAGMKGIWINRKCSPTSYDVKVIHTLNELY
ncbi:HAD family hydrolase [Bacillus sp. 03113]|uniref:HAD family hydrolase n=1 Tax=Bacillus sp. 03113 TaxID=2578211 RepID=UPI00215D2075|nr:HAD-IIIA family hydrolase [Bacillus sp. 03113]